MNHCLLANLLPSGPCMHGINSTYVCMPYHAWPNMTQVLVSGWFIHFSYNI